MLSFIEKTQFNKSSSPDKEEVGGRDNKDASMDSDALRSSLSQVMSHMVLLPDNFDLVIFLRKMASSSEPFI